MNSTQFSLDLRRKTQEQVTQMVKEHDLGLDNVSDITRLYPNLSDDGVYVSVICIWLSPMWEEIRGEIVDKDKPKVTFILWNGIEAPQRYDADLHGFVKNDGTIDWGQCKTLDLMR